MATLTRRRSGVELREWLPRRLRRRRQEKVRNELLALNSTPLERLQ